MLAMLVSKLLAEILLVRYQHHIVDCVSLSKMLHEDFRTKQYCNLHVEIVNSMMELGKR